MTAHQKVVVVGGGTMGADVSLVFIRGGYEVEIIEAGQNEEISYPSIWLFKPKSSISIHQLLSRFMRTLIRWTGPQLIWS